MPSEHGHFHPGVVEETVLETFGHSTLDPHPKRATSSSQLHFLRGKGVLTELLWWGPLMRFSGTS